MVIDVYGMLVIGSFCGHINMKFVEIESIEEVGEFDTFDITNYRDDVYNGEGNFLIDGTVVHNSIPDYVKNRDDKSNNWTKGEHNDIIEILKPTSGVIVFQEQLTSIWQRIAGFTGPESQDARKAVAKKWKDKLKPVREHWIIGASKKIGESKAHEYWDKMETFGRYAFNACLCKDTIVTDLETNDSLTIEQWYTSNRPLLLMSDCDGEIRRNRCETIHYNGEQEVFLIEFEDGTTEQTTLEHQFKCEDGQYYTVEEICQRGLEVIKPMYS